MQTIAINSHPESMDTIFIKEHCLLSPPRVHPVWWWRPIIIKGISCQYPSLIRLVLENDKAQTLKIVAWCWAKIWHRAVPIFHLHIVNSDQWPMILQLSRKLNLGFQVKTLSLAVCERPQQAPGRLTPWETFGPLSLAKGLPLVGCMMFTVLKVTTVGLLCSLVRLFTMWLDLFLCFACADPGVLAEDKVWKILPLQWHA